MLIKQEENNVVTKNKDDKMTRYLKRILQRYFEIEEQYSKETREAIIIQAFTRLKEALNAEANDAVICINEKSGAICLDITDLNGEPKFDKRTAYNKEFCENNEEQEDTIVRGNDYRLNDNRIPLAHVHTTHNINGLDEILEQYEIINNAHVHKNKDVLDLIRYSGAMTSIDLLLLEELSKSADEYIIHFEEQDSYVFNVIKRFINQFDNLSNNVTNRINYIKSKLDSWINFTESAEYADKMANDLKNELNHLQHSYLSHEELATLRSVLNTVPHIIVENDFQMNSRFNIIYNNEDDYGNIKLIAQAISETTINNSDLSYVHNGNLNNAGIEVYLEYTDKNNESCKELLPTIINLNDNVNDTLDLTYMTSSDNKLSFFATRAIELSNIFEFKRQLQFEHIVSNSLSEYEEEYGDKIYIDYKNIEDIEGNNYYDDIIDYVPNETTTINYNGYTITTTYETNPFPTSYNNLDSWENFTKFSIHNNNSSASGVGVKLIRRYYYDGEPITNWTYVDSGLWDNYDQGVNANYDWHMQTPIMSDPIVAIKGKCISYTKDEETYEIYTKYGYSQIEEVGYKFQVFSSYTETQSMTKEQKKNVNYGSFQETPEMKFNVYNHNIDKHTIRLGIIELDNIASGSEITINQYCKITRTNISNREDKYIIKIKRPYDKGLFFENTDNNFTNEEFEKYSTENNFTLASSEDLDYLKLIYDVNKSSTESSERVLLHNNKVSKINNYGTIEDKEDNENINDYFGVFSFKKLSDILKNAKIHYQILQVPGKGES